MKRFDPTTFSATDLRWYIRTRLASWYAAKKGHKGRQGGWIYNTENRAIAQGWASYYERCRENIHIEFWESGSLIHPCKAYRDAEFAPKEGL